jgi:serine protease Do
MKTIFPLFILFILLVQGVTVQVNAQVTPGSFLGVFLADLDEPHAKKLKSPESRGAVVGKVVKDSPAEKAGVLENDIIVAFDNQPVTNAVSVYSFLAESLPGSSVLLRLVRNGSEQDLTVIVTERQSGNGASEYTTQNQYSTVRRTPILGINGTTLTEQLAQFFGIPNQTGLLVTEVVARSTAARNGLQAGDCILAINEQGVSSLASTVQIYSEFSLKGTMNSKPVKELIFKVIRDQKELMIAIKIEQFKD